MEDTARVAVADGGDELVEVLPAEILREATLRDLPEELSAADEVHDEENFVFGSENLVETHDVGVVEPAHDSDFTLHVSGETRSAYLLLVDDFHGHALSRLHVARIMHLREGAAPDNAPELVLSEQGSVLHSQLLDLRHGCTRDRTLALNDGGNHWKQN